MKKLNNIPGLPIIDPQWLTGFVDGEGCFYIKTSKNKVNKYRVELCFFINQSVKSGEVLYAIQNYFGTGNIRYIDKDKKFLRYEISSFKSVNNIIIPHFDRYPLFTSKRLNYLDFKKVAEMIQNKEHLTTKGLESIKDIKGSMNKGKTDETKISFMNSIANKIVISPSWLSGFIDGEGYFGINIGTRNKKNYCGAKLSIGQNAHDKVILIAIANYLNVTNNIFNNIGNKSYQVKRLDINKINILQDKIVPILTEYPLLTGKRKDFEYWQIIVGMIANKEHLTLEGFNKINHIVSIWKQ